MVLPRHDRLSPSGASSSELALVYPLPSCRTRPSRPRSMPSPHRSSTPCWTPYVALRSTICSGKASGCPSPGSRLPRRSLAGRLCPPSTSPRSRRPPHDVVFGPCPRLRPSSSPPTSRRPSRPRRSRIRRCSWDSDHLARSSTRLRSMKSPLAGVQIARRHLGSPTRASRAPMDTPLMCDCATTRQWPACRTPGSSFVAARRHPKRSDLTSAGGTPSPAASHRRAATGEPSLARGARRARSGAQRRASRPRRATPPGASPGAPS